MRTRSRTSLLAGLVAGAALTACSALGPADDPAADRADPGGPASETSAASSAASSATTGDEPATDADADFDPDAPSSWGPTAGEIAEARALVARWSPKKLAGQVIVGRYHGTDPGIPADLVRRLHLAGVQMTSGNVLDGEQVRATTQAVADAVAETRDVPPVMGIDQEGGYVSHLDGVATEYPSFAAAGAAIERDGSRGRVVVRQAAYTTALELRDLGFTWVFAPVGDVTIGSADPTIGTRSASEDPAVATKATAAAVRGYDEAGLVSTVKHFPGHGSALSDSHDTLPELTAPLEQLRVRDLPPFEAAIASRAPAVMMAHLSVDALAPGVPGSLAPEVYGLLREDLGFEGVTITDSLGMGAVAGLREPAVQALLAGADLLLMPVDTEVTHGIVTDAVRSGEIPRERIEEAAARVVAVQRWQQRVAGQVPVPDDVATVAAEASAALTAAAYG